MAKKISPDSRVKMNRKIIWREVAGETVIVDTATSDYYTLNTLGTEVWKLLGARKKVSEIIETLNTRYNAKKGRIARDVNALLKTFLAEKIVTLD